VRIAKPFLAAVVLLTAALPLSACTAAPVQEAHVVVRIAPSAHPESYEVHLAQQRVDFRSRFTLRSGETRTVTVPKGWVTVRVAGVCVVPTTMSGTTTVEVKPDDCRIV
jgi:stringent starvation protein B